MSKTNIPKVNTEDELIANLKNLDISLPPVGEGRTKNHDERLAICMLLSTLAKENELKYPLALTHQERPDFKLDFAYEVIGIEVTFARNKNQAEYKAKMNRSNQQKIYSTTVFRPDECLSKEEMNELIEQDVTGFPLMGDRPYKNWAEYVTSSIQGNLEGLNKSEFEKFSKNILIVFVETPERVAVTDVNKAIEYLL